LHAAVTAATAITHQSSSLMIRGIAFELAIRDNTTAGSKTFNLRPQLPLQ
jgi:hypothetical protein